MGRSGDKLNTPQLPWKIPRGVIHLVFGLREKSWLPTRGPNFLLPPCSCGALIRIREFVIQ